MASLPARTRLPAEALARGATPVRRLYIPGAPFTRQIPNEGIQGPRCSGAPEGARLAPARRSLEKARAEPNRAKAKLLRDKMRDVVIVDPHRVRFALHEAWPDFMTFYGTFVSGAGWIAPRKCIEQG